MRSSSPPPAAVRRSRTMASCCARTPPTPGRRKGIGAGAGHLRIVAGTRPPPAPAAGQNRRLSRGLFPAARPGDHRPAASGCWPRRGFEVRTPEEAHLCWARPGSTTSCSRRSPTRLGAASSPTSTSWAGRYRHRQHRLHDAARERHGYSGRPYGRTAGLGKRRPDALANRTRQRMMLAEERDGAR